MTSDEEYFSGGLSDADDERPPPTGGTFYLDESATASQPHIAPPGSTPAIRRRRDTGRMPGSAASMFTPGSGRMGNQDLL